MPLEGKHTILFDLGGTLVRYYERNEFPDILRQSIAEVEGYLQSQGLLRAKSDEIYARVGEENHEANDHRVRPLEERLARIFQLDASPVSEELSLYMCRYFMKPIFQKGRIYEDTLPVLKELKGRGFRTGIVSNTSWGSPALLWREEIERMGLAKHMNAVVFCRDVGWRKPSNIIFEFALDRLKAKPQECIFVGDEPKWDIVGPRAVGMTAILIDRNGNHGNQGVDIVRSLHELLPKLRDSTR